MFEEAKISKMNKKQESVISRLLNKYKQNHI